MGRHRVQDVERALNDIPHHRQNGNYKAASQALQDATQAADSVTEQGGTLTQNCSQQLADAQAWDLSTNHR